MWNLLIAREGCLNPSGQIPHTNCFFWLAIFADIVQALWHVMDESSDLFCCEGIIVTKQQWQSKTFYIALLSKTTYMTLLQSICHSPHQRVMYHTHVSYLIWIIERFHFHLKNLCPMIRGNLYIANYNILQSVRVEICTW